MITLDSLRSAALANQPWSELDRLVQAELSSGRLTNQIYDELVGMMEELRATPGFGEQSEEAFGDTLDRLSGFCHVDSAYKNPPTLPTEEEIAKLPRWARVAFAARCARRVLHLYYTYRPRTEKLAHRSLRYKIQDPEWSVRQAELSAASAQSTTDSKTGYLEAAGIAYSPHDVGDQIAHNATQAAAYAAADAGDDSRSERAKFAMNCSVVASKPLADVTGVVRRDFDHLIRIATAKQWDNSTPVPPEVFGPLWPDGPPKGWPVDPEAPQRTDIALEVVSREGLDERIVEDESVSLFNALNCYHIARGGQPLSLEEFRPLIAALVPAGV